jgi:hypothetical protein
MLPLGESWLAMLRSSVAAAADRRRRRTADVPRRSHDINQQVRRIEERRSREFGPGG